jgi:hypothetical protein
MIAVPSELPTALRSAAILTYDLDKDGTAAVLIEESMTFPEATCAAATRLVEERHQIGEGKYNASNRTIE